MSELIQNNAEKQAKLREIVNQLHAGSDTASVKKQFDRLIRDVSPDEIAALEQGLINEGVPVAQVQELCDIHVAVFQSALERQKPGKVLPGHPVHTYREENRIARRKLRVLARAARRSGSDHDRCSSALADIGSLELHYQRKENQLCPYLEGVGFTGPSKVMWGKHDEIRSMLSEVQAASSRGVSRDLTRAVRKFSAAVRRMIFMEERILFPTALRKLPETAWADVRRGERQIGYAWTNPGNLWDANVVYAQAQTSRPSASSSPSEASSTASGEPVGGESAVGESVGGQSEGSIPLDVGALLPAQINMMLKVLPIDVTYVDEKDRVRYYSQGVERIFPRSPGIIGRDVANCHPPKSVHIVEEIINSFRKRERETADFWFTMNDRFLYVRYFAVYDDNGNYRGTVEVSQDVTDIRELSGEQRLLPPEPSASDG